MLDYWLSGCLSNIFAVSIVIESFWYSISSSLDDSGSSSSSDA